MIRHMKALLLLGKTTDTQDISGEILEEGMPGNLTEEEVRSCIESFIGEYDQIPPMYSALKVNGKKLYELAREGKTVERKSRKVRNPWNSHSADESSTCAYGGGLF